MPITVIVDDVASIAGSKAFADLPQNDNAVISVLRDPRDLESSIANGFAAAVDTPGIIVTTDARLGSAAGAARRVADIGLLGPLLDDPDAVYQFFALWTPPERLTAAAEALAVDGVVPVHRSLGAEYLFLGIAEDTMLRTLAASGWNVAALGAPNLPDTHDLYLVRDAVAADDYLDLIPAYGAQVLLSSEDRLFVAVPAESSIEELHFPVTRHGHNVKLLPNKALLTHGVEAAADFALPPHALELASSDAELVSEVVTASRIEELVEQLSGVAPVNGSPIVSRHIVHPDAVRAVEMVADELAALGLTAQRHNFFHQGKALQNVFADIAGTGEGMVWITAHLDSTAMQSDEPYAARSDPAPGADDDASGTAAVLATAAALKALAETATPTRTIRFALFNAEEHGLAGSGNFAIAAANAGLQIDAVFQHDMIGYLPAGADRRFEIHCGHRPNPMVEERSVPLADLIAASAAVFGELGEAEIYVTPDIPNREDPADGRSDHSSFQQCGFPAVIACENFFAGTVEEPDLGVLINQTYHKNTDTSINAIYAASIARATALAAWSLAKQ